MVNPYIASQIISWQKKSGRHNLPWQKTNDAYLIWISEVMLQQTQVNTVIPYFNKFIKNFPNVNKLASADEDTVMQYWSGLGYYRRAKFIMQSAKIIVRDYHSRFPKTAKELVTLPGIGRSTAGAISALAFKNPAPILDANVKRVFCRFYGIKKWPGESETDKKLWKLAEKNLPKKEISIYTQALMDLGATLCKAKLPLCKECPLKKKCISFKNNWTDIIPAKKRSKEVPTRETHILIVEKSGYILLEKRMKPGIWEGLWSLPETQKYYHNEKWVENFLGASPIGDLKEGSVMAIFSHYKMRLLFKHIYINEPTIKKFKGSFKWQDKKEIMHAGLPAPIKKLLSNI